MNIAMILAGGVDPRFSMNIPKQFLNVYNRPIIVYTLEAFQKHDQIDEIIVVCIDGWQEMVRAYAKQFEISKLKEVIIGGKNAQDSVARGTDYLESYLHNEDYILIHDAIRPLVDEDTITRSIKMCSKMGNGIAAVRTMDTMMYTQTGTEGTQSINRDSIVRIQTPQTYRYEILKNIQEQAKEKKIIGQVDMNSVAALVGKTLYFSKGSDLNFKINSLEDVEMFKAIYAMKQGEL